MALPLVRKALNNPVHTLPEEPHANTTPEKTGVQFELPPNFGVVVDGIYRSSFPESMHLAALKALRLKTIITLVDEPYSPAHEQFLLENNITHYRIIVQAHKDPTTRNPDAVINKILQLLLDPGNHPILVHCNKGKHRTGCIVACLRKAQEWGSADTLDEYRRYSYPKSRDLDERFICDFDVGSIARLAEENNAPAWTSSGSPIPPPPPPPRGPSGGLF